MARRGKRRKKGKRKSQKAAQASTAATKSAETDEAKAEEAKAEEAKAEEAKAEEAKAEVSPPAKDKLKNTAELDTGWDDDGMDLPEVKSASIPLSANASKPAAEDREPKAEDREPKSEDREPKSAAKKAAAKKAVATKSSDDKTRAAAKKVADDNKAELPAARTLEYDESDVFPPPNEPSPVTYLRRLDTLLGIAEQAVLCLLLATLIGTAAYTAFMGNVYNKSIDWGQDIIRYSVFYIAMFGAAIAAQRQRMISMDILTRLMSERTKAYLRVFMALFVMFLCYLLIQGGLDAIENEAKFTESGGIISQANAILALPIGAGLIGLHFLLHLLIDVRYLSLGKVPPQPKGLQVH